MVGHASILLPMKSFLLHDTGKPCSKFGEDRSINNVTILSTDVGPPAGRTDGRLRDFILCPTHTFHWTDMPFCYLSSEP